MIIQKRSFISQPMKYLLSLSSLFMLSFSMCRAQQFTAKGLPDSISVDEWGDFHVQGIAVDTKNGYVYFSFTDKLIKTDLAGNMIGSVTGIVGHLGDLTFDPETHTVYGSLEYKNDAIGKGIKKKLGVEDNNNNTGFYIAMFNGSLITKPNMSAGEDDVLKTIYLKEVLDDYSAPIKIGDRRVPHRFGCSGIDGITLAPSVGSKSDNKKYLYVAYGIYSDTTRDDNDHQVILKYDITGWQKKSRPLIQKSLHRSGPSKPAAKYFVKTGNTTYGVQNLEYDSFTGNFYTAVYPGIKSWFPNYKLFVIDGRKMPTKKIINSDKKALRVESLPLLDAGQKDLASGIRGWNFKWGATGLVSLGGGYFYLSHDKKNHHNKHSTTLYKYQWAGTDTRSFVRAE